MQWRNLNIETEKSEQTVFAQIRFLYLNIKIFYCACCKAFQALHNKIGLDQNCRTCVLSLKVPITTAADDIHKYFFIVFQRK